MVGNSSRFNAFSGVSRPRRARALVAACAIGSMTLAGCSGGDTDDSTDKPDPQAVSEGLTV
jgi:hypothetical protein